MSADRRPSVATRIARYFARPKCLAAFVLEPVRHTGGTATLVLTVSGHGTVRHGPQRYAFGATGSPTGTTTVNVPVRVGERAVLIVADSRSAERVSFSVEPSAAVLPALPRLENAHLPTVAREALPPSPRPRFDLLARSLSPSRGACPPSTPALRLPSARLQHARLSGPRETS